MIPAHRVEAVLGEGGTLHLEHLPFLDGQPVEVVVYPSPPAVAMRSPGTIVPDAEAEIELDSPPRPIARRILAEPRRGGRRAPSPFVVEDGP